MSTTKFVTFKREFRFKDTETGRERIIPRNWSGELPSGIIEKARAAGALRDDGDTVTGVGTTQAPAQTSLGLDAGGDLDRARAELADLTAKADEARKTAEADHDKAQKRLKAAEEKAEEAEARLAAAEKRADEAEKRAADAEAAAVEAETAAAKRSADAKTKNQAGGAA